HLHGQLLRVHCIVEHGWDRSPSGFKPTAGSAEKITMAVTDVVTEVPPRARPPLPAPIVERAVEIVTESWQPIAASALGYYAVLLALVAFLPSGLPGFLVGALATAPLWLLAVVVLTDPKIAFARAGLDAEHLTAVDLERAFPDDAIVAHD